MLLLLCLLCLLRAGRWCVCLQMRGLRWTGAMQQARPRSCTAQKWAMPPWRRCCSGELVWAGCERCGRCGKVWKGPCLVRSLLRCICVDGVGGFCKNRREQDEVCSFAQGCMKVWRLCKQWLRVSSRRFSEVRLCSHNPHTYRCHARPNVRDTLGRTAVLLASQGGHVELVTLLILFKVRCGKV